MNKAGLSEDDISVKFITPALIQAELRRDRSRAPVKQRDQIPVTGGAIDLSRWLATSATRKTGVERCEFIAAGSQRATEIKRQNVQN